MRKFATMPASRIGGALKLFLLFAVQVGFVVVFHALGSIEKLSIDFSNISLWLDTTSPEIALVASIRLLALVFSYWMLSTSLIYMLARSFHLTALVRAMEFTTIPGVRKIIDAGLAAAIVGGTVFGGAAAVFAKQADASKMASPAAATRVLFNPNVEAVGSVSASPLVNPEAATSENSIPIVGSNSSSSSGKKVVLPLQEEQEESEIDDSTPSTNEDGNYIPTPAERYVAPSVDDEDLPAPAESSTSPKIVLPTEDETTTTDPKVTVPPTSAPVTSDADDGVEVGGKQVVRDDEKGSDEATEGTYTVVSGDNFWKIARQQVRDATGSEPSNAEIANYWVRLIDANRENIRSGDPDLIFPGEVFNLPPV